MTQTTGTALVTGADRGLGIGLTKELLQRGWRVYAGQYMPEWQELDALRRQFPSLLIPVELDVSSTDSVRAAAKVIGKDGNPIDVMINNAGIISWHTQERSIRDSQDYDEIHRVFDVNTLGPIRVVEVFLSLMENSEMKRLCFVSSEAGSITRCYRKTGFGYNMSKTALNMAVKVMYNELHPHGFTFRVYHPGWVRSYMSGEKNPQADLEPEEAALPAVNYFLTGLRQDPVGFDENQLVMKDYQGNEWPW